MGNVKVITIAREYAAGGSTVAKKVSELTGLPWYDHDLARIISENTGFSVSDVISDGEELSKKDRIIDYILNNANSYNSMHDKIFAAQKEFILELAKNPCIIVGRCANVILKEAGINSVNVFLHADKEVRLERAKELTPYTGDKLSKYIDKRDDFRKNYYETYTGRSINSAVDYTICLDTGVIDYDKCAQMIKDIL